MFQSSAKRRRDSDDHDTAMDNWPMDKKQRLGSHFAFHHGLSLAPAALNSPPTILFSSALTPAHSDSGDSSDSPPPSAAWLPFTLENDVDMMDDRDAPIASSPPLHSPMPPFSSRPSKLDPTLFGQSVSGGRMPTPIHNSFTPHPLRARQDTMYSDSNPGYGGVDQGPPTKFPDVIQRMPSPISEDDADVDLPTMQTESQLSRLSVDDMEGLEEVSVALSPRKGRARSGAITGKKRFAMGYREDCERCRLRVPGHYAHFLPG